MPLYMIDEELRRFPLWSLLLGRLDVELMTRGRRVAILPVCFLAAYFEFWNRDRDAMLGEEGEFDLSETDVNPVNQSQGARLLEDLKDLRGLRGLQGLQDPQ
ncbi:uncharacterized protein BO95DRAFT_429623 [Aspergillus brunneoviolaceus CBS 621.78]|uniref:Uncharacterized protein n=1 Tax=Aspergillus brunneoviolaceus CBS 621.78 TaxID=1450534 RepID=A0ACD1GGE7_9EURO|nr:hypothetical protein BO95DRAFT_429623 [Aspergillus brunneoviolaceus CBS 621.78]RAH48235.1 hypothetical protein BO95DRAFT_429623 [Aspergillus brunneoviolaceus CBS 621.78]